MESIFPLPRLLFPGNALALAIQSHRQWHPKETLDVEGCVEIVSATWLPVGTQE